MKVMVLGAGGAAANGFIRSLRKAGRYTIIGCNADEHDLELADADVSRILPREGEWDYRAELTIAVMDTFPKFIHAQPDQEVRALANIGARFNWPTFLPHLATIDTCQDKWASYEQWEKAGITVPESRLLWQSSDLGRAFKSLGDVWIRKRIGAGGAGALHTDDWQYAKLWITNNGGWGEFMASRYLPGESVTWQSVWLDGEVILSQQRLRHAWGHGKIGLTRVAETCSDEAVEETAEAAVRAIDPLANGIFGVDMLYDEHFVPHVTEINVGRFFTTIEFFTELGFNMPDLYVRLGTGEHVATERNPLADGWYWVRGMDRRPILTRKWTT